MCHQALADIKSSIKRSVLPIAYLAAFYLSVKLINLSPGITKLVDTLAIGFVTIEAALLISAIVIYIFGKYWDAKVKDSKNDLTLKWIGRIIKVLVWGVALILFLDNIGIKVNSLVAGLGIGGLAIAFASQAVLVDVFCFFTIFFDRPFEIGDFIIVGEQMGH